MKARVLYYIALTVVFTIGGFFIIAYAAGYKIDIQSRRISSTGMIVIQTEDADIFVNGESVGNDNATLRHLAPGQYEIEISKEGYQTWVKTIELTSGEAEIINDDILFKTTPTIEEYKISQTDFFNKLADTDGVAVQDGELYQNGNFVTRFAEPIKGACWYSDRRYIAYTYQNTLKIIEIDGTNEISIGEKKSDTPVVFLSSGRSVVYESDGKVYKADIR